MTNLEELLVKETSTLREVMERINANMKGIALLLDAAGRLRFTITDGDMRRAILRGFNLDMTVMEWAGKAVEVGNRSPTVAKQGKRPGELINQMRETEIRHLPLVDAEGRVVDVAVLEDLVLDAEAAVPQAVIMAGGFGKRLQPHTADTPKPMLRVGDRPILEWIVGQLRGAGVRDLVMTTHYQSEKIRDHFGSGKKFGVNIDYVEETQPRGTAGALGMMKRPTTTQLVMNADILTKINFRAMLDFHREARAELTMAVRQYEFEVPYGVVETSGIDVVDLSEKPRIRNLVNAGIYLLEPSSYDFFPRTDRFDMTDVVKRLVAAKRRVISFPISEYWMDIGRPGDLEQAQQDAGSGKVT